MGICAHSARDLCALSTEVGRNENQAALVLKSGCSGIRVVAGLVPATSRDISVKDYTESHADLADAWGQCHTKGWWPAPGRPLHCHQ